MHFHNGTVPEEYTGYIRKKRFFIISAIVLLIFAVISSISLGSVKIGFFEVIKTLLNIPVSKQFELIIWNIRLPQTMTAVVAGAGLACSGTVMQSVLRNPLASPFTLGISHAAAFGAAFSVMVLGSGIMESTVNTAVNISNPFVTLSCAFLFSMATAILIIYISKIKGASPQVMILTGAFILLGADIVARLILLPHVLPVSIFTSFLGAPVFIYLIIKGHKA